MEFDLAVPSDKGRGDQVTITIRDEEEEQASPANPQLLGYCLFLCVMSVLSSIQSAFFHSKHQALKQHPGGVFVILTFVAMSVTILASGILVFTSCYLKSYMRIIHYTVLKAVGSVSAILAPFYFGAALFVLDNPSKTVYTLIGVISVGIVVGCCFYWKYAFSQQPTDFNELDSSFRWILLIFVPIPLEFVSSPFIPDNLFWIVGVVCFVQSLLLSVVVIKVVIRQRFISMGTSTATV